MRDPDLNLVTSLRALDEASTAGNASESVSGHASDLAAIISRTPFLLTRCSADLRYLFVSPAYALMLGVKPEELEGKRIVDVMGEEGFETISPHVRRVLHGEPVEYESDVDFKGVGTRRLVVRYVPDRNAAGRVTGWIASILDITDKQRAETRYRELVEACPDGIFVTQRAGQFEDVNPAGCKMLDMTREEILSTTYFDIIAPEEHHRIAETLAAYDAGAILRNEWRLKRKDGSIFIGEIVGRKMADGRLQGVVRDITERKLHDERIQSLNDEIAHRSKNLLAVVDAIARHTITNDTKDFRDQFSARIQSLARSHDLLAGQRWGSVELGELANSQLTHFLSGHAKRIRIAGPGVSVSPNAAQTLGMAFHELATNAAKYGSLSNDKGRVDLGWRLTGGGDGGRQLVIEWCESGGPPARAPQRLGFGTRVLKELIELNLDARVDLEFAESGFTWRAAFPYRLPLDVSALAEG